MKVLVTGGSGLVGRRLKIQRPEWIYVSSKEYDLTNMQDCLGMLNEYKPGAVIHLAAKVGGIKDNIDNPGDFFYKNVSINTNIVHACYMAGVGRLLASLSTCIFPDVVHRYPFSEEDVFSGPPAQTNFSYGYAKRAMLVQINSYRKQYGLNYSTFCPSNIYGPGDNFYNDKAHFISSMIRKMTLANEGGEVELWGTGTPLRQQLYVDDLVAIIPILLEKHNSDTPIIVSPNENLSIRSMADICSDIFNKNLRIVFNGAYDGQNRKDGSNQKFLELVGGFEFTLFRDGLKRAIAWHISQKQQ